MGRSGLSKSGLARTLAERGGGEVAALEVRLDHLLVQAQSAWPGIDVPDDVLLAHLEEMAGQAGDPALSSLEVSDLYLAVACASGHAKALAAFEKHHIAKVPQLLGRLRPTADFVEEVQQVLREKLLLPQADRPPRIAEYSGRGALGAWVRVAAIRTALSLHRKRQSEPSPEDAFADPAASSTDPELRALQIQYRPHLKSALHDALESLEATDRSLLRRQAIEGRTVEELGEELGVHGSTISRRLARIRRGVLDETRKNLMQKVPLRGTELDSLIRAVHSNLDVSVRRILGASER